MVVTFLVVCVAHFVYLECLPKESYFYFVVRVLYSVERVYWTPTTLNRRYITLEILLVYAFLWQDIMFMTILMLRY